MKGNWGLLAAMLVLTAAATGGFLPAGLVFLVNFGLTAALILLFARTSLPMSAGSVLLLAAAAGGVSKSLTGGAIHLVLTLLPAALVGFAVHRRFSYGKLFSVVGLAALFPLALFVPFAYPSIKLQLLSAGESLAEQLRFWGQGVGYSAVKIAEMEKTLQGYLDFIVRVVPALYYLSGIVFLALAHLLALWTLRKGGLVLPGPQNFLAWQAPFLFTLLLGTGLAGHLFLENGWLKAADNLLLLAAFGYAVCGASNLEYFFKKMSTHWAIKGLFYLWLAVFGLVSFFILSAVGFLDSRFDFRRLRPPVEVKSKESEE